MVIGGLNQKKYGTVNEEHVDTGKVNIGNVGIKDDMRMSFWNQCMTGILFHSTKPTSILSSLSIHRK